MSEIRFNVNHHCRVRLTPLGREIWRKTWEQIDRDGHMANKVDADGWLRQQLWEIMATLGPHLYNGGAVPFETEIILEIEE